MYNIVYTVHPCFFVEYWKSLSLVNSSTNFLVIDYQVLMKFIAYSKPSLEVGSKLYGAIIYIFCFCVLQWEVKYSQICSQAVEREDKSIVQYEYISTLMMNTLD